MKRIFALCTSILCLLTMLSGCDSAQKRKADELYEVGNYEEATKIYEEIGDREMQAMSLFRLGDYLNAAQLFAETGNRHMQAESLYEANHYSEAKEIFEELNDWTRAADCTIGISRALSQIKPIR